MVLQAGKTAPFWESLASTTHHNLLELCRMLYTILVPSFATCCRKFHYILLKGSVQVKCLFWWWLANRSSVSSGPVKKPHEAFCRNTSLSLFQTLKDHKTPLVYPSKGNVQRMIKKKETNKQTNNKQDSACLASQRVVIGLQNFTLTSQSNRQGNSP